MLWSLLQLHIWQDLKGAISWYSRRISQFPWKPSRTGFTVSTQMTDSFHIKLSFFLFIFFKNHHLVISWKKNNILHWLSEVSWDCQPARKKLPYDDRVELKEICTQLLATDSVRLWNPSQRSGLTSIKTCVFFILRICPLLPPISI